MPTITETPSEKRQVAKVLTFPADTADYINWQSIAVRAREMASHFDARIQPDGGLTVTFFWTYTAEELAEEGR